ncbi:hypothetical protein VST7929_03003 [Vibrio stylophorae]|uniref:HAD family hydrolase n=1 Tax=Vibrio stylophorae TaxID=659351 RepID=A0ABN8DW23_9VIBR|nr:haloacid dehalogenase-like hydrolase [Vibrio stylophorae]CAH0535429.1 hypothetical protein VST7929_03003 [Vibrio stylophorae]
MTKINHQHIAFFDLDQTLSIHPLHQLWHDYLVAHAHIPGDTAHHIEAQAAALKGQNVATLIALAKKLSHQYFPQGFLPDAITRIHWHQRRGDLIVILSSLPNVVVDAIVSHIPNALTLAPELQSEQGQYTGRLYEQSKNYEQKALMLKLWLAAQPNANISTSGYSESAAHLDWLKKMDRPFAVNPEPTLALHAEQYEWTIFNWQHPQDIVR